ncbi:MAG: hypothetical protein M3018_05655 [Actinomycetota bacterium]|nr:hypothetical protein [Actinomycetota bacterium]
MTAIAPDTDQLRELDEGTRAAWAKYRSSLRDLEGDDYERAEHESWTELQSELRRLERRRNTLTTHAG